MAQYSGFFNSEIGDIREYNASEFAEYFSRFVSDGIYSENNELGLKVNAQLGLNISVSTGYAYIRGYLYKNDTPINLQIDGPDTILSRIDRVVLRLDVVEREIVIDIKKGEFASTPTPPVLVDTGTIKELSLAQVRIIPNAQSVVITDERRGEHCGVVSLLIDIPLQDLFEEWNYWKQQTQAEYEAWLASLEQILDENVAGNLLTEINKKMDKTKITISPLDADITKMAEGDIWIKYE